MGIEKHSIDKIIGDGAIVALLLTGSVFLSVYSLHVGYCEYYNIPKSLIRINTNIIAEWFKSFGMFFLLFSLFEVFLAKMLFPLFKQYPTDVFSEQYQNYIWIIFCLFFLFIQVIFRTGLILCLAFASVLTIFVIVFIVTHRKYKSGSLQVTSNESSEDTDYSKLSVIKLLLGKKILPLLLLVFFLVSLSTEAGKEMGREQDLFYQINGRTDIVGIQIYDDYIVSKWISDESFSSTILIYLSEVTSVGMVENPEFKEIAESNNSKKKNPKNETKKGNNDSVPVGSDVVIVND